MDILVKSLLNQKVKWGILIVVILGYLVYFFALFNSFLWDDFDLIVNYKFTHSLSYIPSFFTFSLDSQLETQLAQEFYKHVLDNYYRPVFLSVLTILYQLFGVYPFFYHLFLITSHIIDTILLFLIFGNFFGSLLPLFLALVFLVHPVNVESVAFVSDITNLYLLFGLLGLYLIIKKPIKYFDFGVILSLLMSILIKETGFILMIIIYSYILIYERSKAKKYTLIFVSIGLVYGFLRFMVASVPGSTLTYSPTNLATLPERLVNIPMVLIYYLGVFFYPVKLMVNQHWFVRQIDFSQFYLPLIVLLAILVGYIVLSVWLFKVSKTKFWTLIFFGLWLILSLSIHIQIIPIYMTVSDRFMYLPMIGWLGILGVVISQVRVENKQLKDLILVLGISLIFLLSIRTMIRSLDWKDGFALFKHDYALEPDNYDVAMNLGHLYYIRGDSKIAKTLFLKSTQLAPDAWINWNNLGSVESYNKNYEAAKKYYLRSIKNGSYDLAYFNLAALYLVTNDVKSAKELSAEAIKEYPLDDSLLRILAASEYQMGEKDEAIKHALLAFKISPNEYNATLLKKIKGQ